jgi:hypothetical protein
MALVLLVPLNRIIRRVDLLKALGSAECLIKWHPLKLRIEWYRLMPIEQLWCLPELVRIPHFLLHIPTHHRHSIIAETTSHRDILKDPAGAGDTP